MRWLRGAPDGGGARVRRGGPRAAAGCAGCRPGLLPRAAPPPSRAPGPAPIWGGPTACGGPGGREGGREAELAVGAEHPPPASAAAVSLDPHPASLIPHPSSLIPPPFSRLRWPAWEASAKPLTTSASQLPAENWGGTQKQLFLPHHLRGYSVFNNLRSEGRA